MKKTLILFGFFYGLTSNAQDYLITFTGSGESSEVTTVKVENLTSATSLLLKGSDILHLTSITTDVNSNSDNQLSKIKIYPNPMTDYVIMEIFPPAAGDATISVIDLKGKLVTSSQCYLENSQVDFRISGIKNGFYVIDVKGNNYQFSGKLVSLSNSFGAISIEKYSRVGHISNDKEVKAKSKGIQAGIEMAYNDGDLLKFTGISGKYSTVKMNIPTSNITIEFNFLYCTDGDNNDYPTIEIGNQIWMAENLRTTKYYDGSDIPLVTDAVVWDNQTTPGYCCYNNDCTKYKSSYGALYNWYSINTGMLCPFGWHVPSYLEWTILWQPFKKWDPIEHSYGIIGNELMETGITHWIESLGTNETGFTALPGGGRIADGNYTNIGEFSYFWCSDSYDPRWIESYNLRIPVWEYTPVPQIVSVSNAAGLSIRCLKN